MILDYFLVSFWGLKNDFSSFPEGFGYFRLQIRILDVYIATWKLLETEFLSLDTSFLCFGKVFGVKIWIFDW